MNQESKIPEDIFLINEDMWWSKDDVGAYDYLVNTNKDFIERIRYHLTGNTVAIQAGGHCGWMIRELNKQFDYIYTFEPNYLEFTALCMNLPYPNVFKFNACVGNERKMVDMAKHAGQSGANFVSGQGNIPILLIDDLNVDCCNFIQLDLEGYEYYALLGAKNTIEKYKPVLCIERYWNDRFNISAQTIDNLLQSWGYQLVERLGESDHIYKVI